MVTEQKIRTFVDEQNFLKGLQGVRDGAIVNPEQQPIAMAHFPLFLLIQEYGQHEFMLRKEREVIHEYKGGCHRATRWL